jgi:DNA segregation ATPase FtsK/SpoIIIE, S-DNA-T family
MVSAAAGVFMLEQRNLKIDLLALGLLALAIFLAAALLSYDPADPPSKLVFPERTATLNICGRWGALSAKLLLSAFGLGAYYLVLSLAAMDTVLLTRHKITQPLLRAAGWLLSLCGVTTLAAMALPQLSPGPVIGSGGYLGATGRGLMELNFACVGAYILTISMILGGLLLSTDYVLIRLIAWAIGKPTSGFGRRVARVGSAYAQKLGKRRSDLDTEDENEIAVRIAGRPAEEEDDEEEEDSAEDGEEETEEEDQKAAASKKSAAGSPMRIAPPRKNDREKVIEELDSDRISPEAADYELPSPDLLLPGETFSFEEHEKEVRRKAKILEKTFADFGFNIRVVEIQTGPVVAQFEVELEAGLRLSKITGLADDLAIALRVPSVRIVAPIPGKNTVGIEVPNNERQIVRLREVMEEANGKSLRMRIPLFLGKDVSGNPMTVDLSSLPHLLIAGRTGTGKSVCLNSIIASILMTRRPDEVRLLLVDPKMVELSPYKCLPHLMHPVVTDMRKAEAILAWAVDKMEERYHLLARAGVRHVSVYNQLGEEELMERLQPVDEEEQRQIPLHMPYLVIVADELADLMMTAAKEVEGHIIRLAQKSRAVGIHLVLATQKPTVDVITGLIKSNLPARICFQVASRTDSRVVLDEMGADKLLGNGDMLFLWPGTSTLIRGQGTYLSDDEINRVIAKVATTEPQYIKELVQLKASEPAADGKSLNSRDELYESAIDVVIREGRGSVSLLQRALGIGYGRAARLIDFMAEDGFVGPYNGSQAREVLISMEEWQNRNGQAPADSAAEESASSRRNNKILLDRPDDNHPGLPALAVPKSPPTLTTVVLDQEEGDDGEEDDEDYEVDEYDDVEEDEYEEEDEEDEEDSEGDEEYEEEEEGANEEDDLDQTDEEDVQSEADEEQEEDEEEELQKGEDKSDDMRAEKTDEITVTENLSREPGVKVLLRAESA